VRPQGPYGLVTLSRVKSVLLVLTGTLKACWLPLPVSGMECQSLACKVALHSN
jgi:hypothetical protein